jgi:hypothetical protein
MIIQQLNYRARVSEADSLKRKTYRLFNKIKKYAHEVPFCLTYKK